tara:strand:- start:4517 stop:4942 length:426 start_codon:yes stop_codon:yes gene_type:complete
MTKEFAGVMSILGNKIGFTCSSFDLLHAGHVMMLKECKDNCGKLVVGLQTDPTIDRPDKNKPTQSYFERYIQLSAVKHVDLICPYETESDLEKLIYYLSPDIRFIGEDWKGKRFTGIDLGVPIFWNKRHGYSTTELRERIK